MGLFDSLFYSQLPLSQAEPSAQPNGNKMSIPLPYSVKNKDDEDEDTGETVGDLIDKNDLEPSDQTFGGGKAKQVANNSITDNIKLLQGTSPIERTPAIQRQQSPEAAPQQTNYLDKLLGGQMDNLADAQEQGRQQNFIAQLGKAANNLGAAIGRSTANNDVYNDIEKNSGAPANNVLAQNKLLGGGLQDLTLAQKLQILKQDNDPTSSNNKAMRAQLVAWGKDVDDNASGAPLRNMYNQALKDNQLDKKIDAAAALAATRSASKDGSDIDKQMTAYAKAQNPGTWSSRSPQGKAEISVNAATQIQQMVDQVGDGNKLNSRQIHELAIQLDKLLSGGNVSQSSTQALVPHAWSQDASKIEEYITGLNQGAGMGDFVKNMMDTVNREKQVNQKIVGDYQKINAKAQLQGKLGNSDRFKTFNKDTLHLDENGEPVQDYDQDVIDYAKQHNISLEKAQQYKNNFSKMGK